MAFDEHAIVGFMWMSPIWKTWQDSTMRIRTRNKADILIFTKRV